MGFVPPASINLLVSAPKLSLCERFLPSKGPPPLTRRSGVALITGGDDVDVGVVDFEVDVDVDEEGESK